MTKAVSKVIAGLDLVSAGTALVAPPVSAAAVSANRKAKSEQTLRAADAKWETVMRNSIKKRRSSINEPILTVSTIGRGSWDKPDPNLKVRFACVLTVDAPKYAGDLYAEVLSQYTKLRALALRTTPPVRVRV